MKGVIFAAGLGTRLHPLTKDKPKALVTVSGRTMLEQTLLKFEEAGIYEVVVNVHAFADKVKATLLAWNEEHPSMTIRVSDERDLLLETGGGLKNMRSLLEGESFLVHNVDVLTTLNLNALVEADNLFSGHLATLAVRTCSSDRYFLFNDEGILCGWENAKTGEKKISRPEEKHLHRFGFTGIHLIHPEIFDLMEESGVFSITDVYLRLARRHAIRLFDMSDHPWFDIGTPEQLKLAEDNWKHLR